MRDKLNNPAGKTVLGGASLKLLVFWLLVAPSCERNVDVLGIVMILLISVPVPAISALDYVL